MMDTLTQQKNKLLNSFDTDKTKFPNGLSNVTKLKNDKIKWMGVWRNMQGYMKGINPNNNMPHLKEHLNEINQKPLIVYNGKKNRFTKKIPDKVVMPKISKASSLAFYEEMISNTKHNGFDFVKVDFQSDNFLYNRGTSNAVKGVYYNNSAFEESCTKHELGLLNCIALHNFNVFNQKNSILIRGIVDYKTNYTRIDKALVQNFANAFWLGHLHWIDQDMFHTSYQETARLMAISRAIAGGPVYLSDETKNIDDKYLKGMLYKDGKIIGTLAPGVPSIDNTKNRFCCN